ncbi:MAG: L,D-transpeptidase [Alphaproteobacteria bacterium]|nr:L,D-transpeptidase [Alphaproteobacteria bacterium]
MLPHTHRQTMDIAFGKGRLAAQRLRSAIPVELFRYFDLYLYVSKAARGRLAQHMFIFHEDEHGRLVYERSIPVSTGREQQERYFTDTPSGLFQLDPARLERVHYSREWDGAPMPWAMFLKYTIDGRATGVALHAAPGHESHLGHRASGGCIRLPVKEAQLLFRRIRRDEEGLVPAFAAEEGGRRTNVAGVLLRDEAGRPSFIPGLRVLVLIESSAGRTPESA